MARPENRTKRRADSDVRDEQDEERAARGRAQREVESEGDELDYQMLAGESEYSARLAQGLDPEITRDIPLHDRSKDKPGTGPPRERDLSEAPEDMGESYLERVTEAPRMVPPRDAGRRERVVVAKVEHPRHARPRDSETSSQAPIPKRPDPDRE